MTKFKIDTVGIINSLIGSLIIFFVSTVYNYLFKEESFTNALINSLNLNIKLWHIIVFIGLAYFISKLRKTSNAGVVKNTPPAYLEYTKDEILGNEWTWIWKKKEDGSYTIDNLVPLCPNDKTLTIGIIWQYKCPKCNWKLPDIMIVSEVEGIIQDNVYKKYKVRITN